MPRTGFLFAMVLKRVLSNIIKVDVKGLKVTEKKKKVHTYILMCLNSILHTYSLQVVM